MDKLVIFSRSWYLNKHEGLHSTNHWFDENHSEYNDDIYQFHEFMRDNELFMDFLLQNNYEVTSKLFTGTFVEPYLLTLKERKNISYVYQTNEKLKFKNKEKVFNVHSLLGRVIDFDPNYFDWLESKDWKNEQEGHYTKDIQGRLATEIIKKIIFMIDYKDYINNIHHFPIEGIIYRDIQPILDSMDYYLIQTYKNWEN